MPIGQEVRRLDTAWRGGVGWPKRLEWIRIDGLRGWSGERLKLPFPIMAIVGENGVGKSTVLQCAAAVYRQPQGSNVKTRFASDFFRDTPWEKIRNATIEYQVSEGGMSHTGTVRRLSERWRENPGRRSRHIEYVDLSRIQPVTARTGYLKLAKGKEKSSTSFDDKRRSRLSAVMGREYETARMCITDVHRTREVPVVAHKGETFSGFHMGAGETMAAELLRVDVPPTGILLIDEIETSLHPRAQRRLIRDLATLCKDRHLQILLSTHSPYILDELPFDARAYIYQTPNGREIIPGISPDFAMTRMDDVPHHECDLCVEDDRAAIMLTEIIQHKAKELARRCQIVRYGDAGTGRALGKMAAEGRFPRATCVFVDGDQASSAGCARLPGDDPPERVVFAALRDKAWANVNVLASRDYAEVADALSTAMILTNHHDWVVHAANQLTLGGDALWHHMCAAWVNSCLSEDETSTILQPIEDALASGPPKPIAYGPTGQLPLFER